MRLTLRSLLAYLDDVLDPADAAELGRKIEESRFASEIVQRIRSAIRRGQLPAPKPDGKGMGQDANSVAEYLDNVLAVDRLPEFEKVCLDSDMHLAEAAACHQILTLVLGQRAEIDPSMRQRMYGIGSPMIPPGSVDDVLPPPVTEPAIVAGYAPPAAAPPLPSAPAAPPAAESPPATTGTSAAAATAATTPSSAAATTPETDHVTTKPKAEVPDYLREESGSRWWQVLVVLALSFLLAVSILAAMGPLDASHPLAGWIGLKPVDVVQGPDTPNVPTPPPGPKQPTDPKPAAGTPDPKTPMADPKSPMGTPETMGKSPADPMPMEKAPPTPPVGPPAVPMPAPMPMPAVPPVGPAPMPPPVGPIPPPDPGPPVEPMAPVDIGRLSSEDEMLLRMQPDGTWQRLKQQRVQSGDRLHAPPSFRPQVSLTAGIQMTLSGPALVVVGPPDAGGVPRFDLKYGRLVLVTLGMPGTQLVVQTGGGEQKIAFNDADSACAIEFRRFHEPGADPLAVPAQRQVQIFVTGGSVTVTDKTQRPQAVAAGHVLAVLNDEPAKMQPVDTIPDWIAGKDLTKLDHDAAKTLADEVGDRPVTLVLRENSEHRRAEVRSLVVRSLGYLGEFEPYYGALNEKLQKSNWPEQFTTLQACMALGPDEATRIRQGFEKAGSDDAATLYRLVRGFSAEQLRDEGKQLVELLDHQTMAVRVLAFENLKQITGGVTHLYSPVNTASARKSHVQRWRERANAPGGIVYVRPAATPPRAEPPDTSPDPAPVAPLPTVPLPPTPAPAPAPLPPNPGAIPRAVP